MGAMDTLSSVAGGRTADRDTRISIVRAVMDAVKPRNELEGMIAAQMVAANAAAMEAFGRAMREDRIAPYETYLNQANKASRTFVTLLEALDRHRGKGGQQKVRVEHVHVYKGGQAIVGAIKGPGGAGGRNRKSRQSHAQRQQPAVLTHASEPALRSEDQERQPVPIARHGER